jgi:hypothetical protein
MLHVLAHIPSTFCLLCRRPRTHAHLTLALTLHNARAPRAALSYHRAYYRADNMLVLVAGALSPEQLLGSLAAVEARVQSTQCVLIVYMRFCVSFVLWVCRARVAPPS